MEQKILVKRQMLGNRWVMTALNPAPPLVVTFDKASDRKASDLAEITVKRKEISQVVRRVQARHKRK